ncbi:MAG: CBS domain-containing protein [Gemmatimonadota bacterium]
MKIRHILARKGHAVHTVEPQQTVAQAIRLLVSHGIGSLVVTEAEEIRGIITERDILRLADRAPDSLGEMRVEEAMTRELIVAVPDDDVQHVMAVMTKNRVRHLPVVEGGRLQGLVSIGDVVNELRRDMEEENQHMKQYVQGMVR